MQTGGSGASVRNTSADEVARFQSLAERWWDPNGPMRPLHRMNPARIGWIVGHVRDRFPDPGPVRLLDVGCGAGLAAEALAELGYEVLGIDPSPAAIDAARAHAATRAARGAELRLAYRTATAEDLAGARFQVVTALEVIEHVPEPARLVGTLAGLLAPDGVLIMSTINRTARSFLSAKVAAEYVLRWLPAGTHAWSAFLRPAELARMARAAGLVVRDVAGLTLDPISGRWHTSRDVSVNYILLAAPG